MTRICSSIGPRPLYHRTIRSPGTGRCKFARTRPWRFWLGLLALLAAAPPALAQPGGYGRGIVEIARVYALDPALIAAIISVESDFNPRAISRKGARGLMQLMPATAEELGVANIYDPWENIEGGARYFRERLDRFNGDLRLALAAYNAGETPVRRHGGVPPYPETQAFVDEVLARYQALKARGLPSADSRQSSVGVREPSPASAPHSARPLPEEKPAIVLEVEEVGPQSRALAYLQEGVRLERRGQVGKAIEHYRRALALDPALIEARHRLGLLFLGLGRLEEAQTEFESVLRAAPGNARVLNNLGLVLHMRGEFRQALALLRSAWELEPGRVEGGVNLSLVLRRLGQREEARAVLVRVLQTREQLPEGHLHLAGLLEEEGDRAGALRHYRRFLELMGERPSPLSAEVRERMSALARP
jgi:tetratricopeptide (TPR) repeat protein